MKKWLSILSAAGLLLYPLATYAADYGSQQLQTQQAPPVAQTLVREGDFAIKLAAELNLGNPENEATAEDMLAKAGVAPMNGWISDYPVTPEIIGQLNDSIARAAAEGKLPMTSDEASKELYSLAAQMNLPVPAGPGSSGTAQAGQSNPAVINNYYYNEGPPIVTYYPPPADYVYLYDWVPFPVFWFGFWFPGFFICHNFTTTVVVSTNTVFVTRTAIVSNKVINPVTRTVAVVDPVVRTSAGSVQPMTVLRTGNGGMFRTIEDMRKGVAMTGVSAVRQNAFANSPRWSEGFKSPEARKGAESIYSRSVQTMGARRGPEGAMTRNGERLHAAPNGSVRSYSAPPRGEEGRYTTPHSPSRPYGPSVIRGGGPSARPFVAPGAPARSFRGAVIRRGHGPMPWPFGYGRQGRG